MVRLSHAAAHVSVRRHKRRICSLWQIAAMPDNIGTSQSKASVAKAGYQAGQAEATLEVVP